MQQKEKKQPPEIISRLFRNTATSPQKPSRILGGTTLKIAYCALFMVSVANLGFAFMDTTSAWYAGLIKPALMPPDILVPIVWTSLCALGAVSMSLVNIHPAVRKKTLALYALIGVAGVLWIYVFFNRHNLGGSVFLLIAITAAAALLYSESFRTSKAAAYLLLPCILWLCFMLYLNYEIAFFNY